MAVDLHLLSCVYPTAPVHMFVLIVLLERHIYTPSYLIDAALGSLRSFSYIGSRNDSQSTNYSNYCLSRLMGKIPINYP